MENTIHSLTLFYDAKCGICRHARTWLSKQPAYLELRFVDYHSEKAKKLLPAIEELHPEKEVVLLADNGNIYQGGSAWVMCLWATQNWREWSLRLASPTLLPLAGKFVSVVSRNRHRLSNLLGAVENADADTLERRLDGETSPRSCTSESCSTGLAGSAEHPEASQSAEQHKRKPIVYPTRALAIVFSLFELPALAACSLFVFFKFLSYPLLFLPGIPFLVITGVLVVNHLGMAMAKPISHRPWMVWKWTAVLYGAFLLVSLLIVLGTNGGMLSPQSAALALFAMATVLGLIGISMEEDHWKSAPGT